MRVYRIFCLALASTALMLACSDDDDGNEPVVVDLNLLGEDPARELDTIVDQCGAEMALVLYAANEGFLKDVELNKVVAFERALLSYANSEHTALLAKINEKGDFNDEIAAQMKAAIQKFKATQTW